MEGVFFAEPANLWPGRDELPELRSDLGEDRTPVSDPLLPEDSVVRASNPRGGCDQSSGGTGSAPKLACTSAQL